MYIDKTDLEQVVLKTDKHTLRVEIFRRVLKTF